MWDEWLSGCDEGSFFIRNNWLVIQCAAYDELSRLFDSNQ